MLTRLLSRLLWATLGLYALWLLASAVSDALLAADFWPLANALLLAALILLSGVLLAFEWRRNPISETERGEWTAPMLLYSIVFSISFFVGTYGILGWYFS